MTDTPVSYSDLASTKLSTFSEMWYWIFLWALISSLLVHTVAALMAFLTLRKHIFGKYYTALMILMGIIPPITAGVVSSATIALVYRASSYQMTAIYAFIWGVGQTALTACLGFTRILATL